jgi:hypothetical protein
MLFNKKNLINRKGRRFFIEIPAFFIGISILEVAIFGSLTAWIGRPPSLAPHPYWIGILLFALIYGFAEGLIAGIIAVSLLVIYSPLQFGWNPLAWGEVSVLPMFFILVGLLVGVFSWQQKARLTVKDTAQRKLIEEVSHLHQITDQLTRSNLNLEKKIVFRLETFQSVYEIAEKLNKLHLDQLYGTIPQLVAKYFNAEQCSLFLIEPDGSLMLKSTHGWIGGDDYPALYDSNSELVAKLNSFEEIIVLSPESLQKMQVDACFAVALVTQEKKLLGLIKIENIEFLKISQDNIRFLSLLSKWFVQSIINGLRYAEKEKESTFDPRTGLVREDTFWFMVKKIVASAVRHKYETVLMNVSIVFPNSVGSIEKNMLINRIGEILKRTCRIDDEVGIADIDRPYNFMLMMPYTNKDQAKVVLKKASQTITEQLSTAYPYAREPDFLFWEVLSLGDGSLFLSETVQKMIFDPILAGKT